VTETVDSFALDVRSGLGRAGQKELPSKYLYDDVGSALFEAITRLPEYGLTRAEERILRDHSDDIAEHLSAHGMVVELGSGSGRKTRQILEALAHDKSMTYCPIEISSSALVRCERELDDLAHVSILALRQSILMAWARRWHAANPAIPLWCCFWAVRLATSIVGQPMIPAKDSLRDQAGDMLLLGTDLEKPLTQLIPAYDDALGVTGPSIATCWPALTVSLVETSNYPNFSTLPFTTPASVESRCISAPWKPRLSPLTEPVSRCNAMRPFGLRVVINTGGTNSQKWLGAPVSSALRNGWTVNGHSPKTSS